jgi:hypothetical protein
MTKRNFLRALLMLTWRRIKELAKREKELWKSLNREE